MKNTKILSAIYESFIEELPPTSKYKEITKNFEKERKIFLENIESQNAQTLEALCDILHEAGDELNKQAFCEGFSLGVKLFAEAAIEY